MRFLNSRGVFIAGLVVAGFFGVAYVRSYVRDYGIEKEVQALAQKQETLEKNRVELLSVLKKVQNNSYAEAQAREQLGLHKPGEKTVVVQDDGTAPAAAEESHSSHTTTTNPEKWWNYFFGRPDAS